MRKKTLKKYASVTTASFLVLQLGACSSMEEKIEQEAVKQVAQREEIIDTTQENIEETQQEVVTTTNTSENEEIVYNVPDDMTPEEYATSLMEMNTVQVSDSEMADACGEWVDSEDGSSQCIDEDSDYFAQHFFNGIMFASLGAMVSSQIYSSHNLKNGERKNQIIGSAVVSPTNTRVNRPGSNSNESKSNSNSKSSYSSGKTGFSSGGASRGGSAAS